MTNWTAADLPGMTGRTVLITGAGSGIGLIAAREFGRAGARVVLAVRDVDRAAAAIRGTTGDFDVRRLDVSDLDEIGTFAADWQGGLDILVNNAGVMDVPPVRTAQGFDVQTATNYLGPFVLTNRLLPKITDRVVHVTSQLHRRGRVDLGDLAWRQRNYDGMRAYCDSKLELVLFSLELQRRLTESGSRVRSVLAHPGIATTTLAAHSPAGRINKLRFLLNSPEQGALPILYAVTQDVPGNAYVGPNGPGGIKGHPAIRRQSGIGRDPEIAGKLWRATTELITTSGDVGVESQLS